MAENQVLALSGKSRGVLRLEYGKELAFSLESPAYLRDAELWLLFSDREWSILNCCKGSCPLPPRKVQAAAVARNGQFLMAGGKADFSAARSACFTRQEKKRLKELEVSARQRPKPSEISPSQPEGQVFLGEQRKSAGSAPADQHRAEDERPAPAQTAQKEAVPPQGQKNAARASAASETQQSGQQKAQIAPEAEWRGQEHHKAVGAQQAQEPQYGRENEAAPAQATGGQQTQRTTAPARAASQQRRQTGQDGGRNALAQPIQQAQEQTASEQRRFGQEGAQSGQGQAPQMRQAQPGSPAPRGQEQAFSAAFSQNSQTSRRQDNAPQQEQAFSGQESGSSSAQPRGSGHGLEGQRESRQNQPASEPAGGAAGAPPRQWENLPEYVSAPALEELMRAAQPQASSSGKRQAGRQGTPQRGSATPGASEIRQEPGTPAQQRPGSSPRQGNAPGMPREGQQKAAMPGAGNAPRQAARGQSGAAQKTAAHAPAQRGNGQPERPQSDQQKQPAKSAPRHACIQRTEKSVQPFPKIFPSSKWVKVEYPSFPGRGYYLSGEIFQGENCTARALAVPGRYALNPPAWLKGFETYLEDGNAQGYWLLFLDMQGKAIPISQVFKGSQG